MARLYTAKIIVSETQKAQIERLQEDATLVSFSYVESIGNVAVLEYIEGRQDGETVNAIVNLLGDAQVIQISRRTVAR